MSQLSSKTCLFYDHAGLYVHVARAIAPSYGRLLYFSEWRDAFSSSKGRLIGDGFEEIERLRDFEDGLEDADFVVFPDMGRYGLQKWLRSQGVPVWGMGQAEMLEDDKIFFHHWLMAQKDLPSPEMWQFEGVEALEKFLKENEDLYLKSNDRGDFETYHHLNWKLSKGWLQDLLPKIGPYQDEIKVIVQFPVKGVESGYDGYIIDGEFPPTAQIGFECKSKGYVSKLIPYGDLPQPLQAPNEALVRWIQEEGIIARGSFSSEVRIKSPSQGYFIDPTMRFGIPPSATQAVGWENLGAILEAGSRGKLIDIESPHRYMAEVELTSPWANQHFLPVYYPAQFKGLVCLSRAHKLKDVEYTIPSGYTDGPAYVGAAVGYGSTIKEATEMAVEVAESIEALEISYDKDTFSKLEKTLEEYEALGFEF